MTDRRRTPLDEVEQLFERLNREFGEEFGRSRGRPAVDVEETDEKFVVTVDLPGFEREDIDVELRDETVHVSAERESATEETVEPEAEAEEAEEAAAEEADTEEAAERRYLVRERRTGAVDRAVALPEPVDEEGITATFEGGVLRVELPKAGEEATSIEVR